MDLCSSDGRMYQLERDLGIPNPGRLLLAALRRRDGHKEVTPFQRRVAEDRLRSLIGKGHSHEDALIVLLMRGARIEVLANIGVAWPRQDDAEELAADVKARLRQLSEASMGSLASEAQANLDLWRRV